MGCSPGWADERAADVAAGEGCRRSAPVGVATAGGCAFPRRARRTPPRLPTAPRCWRLRTRWTPRSGWLPTSRRCAATCRPTRRSPCCCSTSSTRPSETAVPAAGFPGTVGAGDTRHAGRSVAGQPPYRVGRGVPRRAPARVEPPGDGPDVRRTRRGRERRGARVSARPDRADHRHQAVRRGPTAYLDRPEGGPAQRPEGGQGVGRLGCRVRGAVVAGPAAPAAADVPGTGDVRADEQRPAGQPALSLRG